MSGWTQDVLYTLRQWRARPGLTAVILLTLALGIGANAAIFSLIEAALLRPLPFPQPDRLAYVYSQFPSMGFSKFWVSQPEYLEMARWSRSFEALGAYRVDSANVGGPEVEPRRVVAASATASLLEVLKVRPLAGRVFGAEDDVPGKDAVVLVSERLWRDAFAADPALVGSMIDVEGRRVQVIGILPRGADLDDAGIDLWAPLAIDTAQLRPRGNHYLYLAGRLKPGVTVAQAQADLDGLLSRWKTEISGDQHIPSAEGHPMVVRDMKEELIGPARPALWLLAATVGLVLAIACANVANLLLARSEGRRREVAVRTALGAGAGRLARQFLLEGLLLALVGGTFGTLLAFLGVNGVLAAFPGSVIRVERVAPSLPVLAFVLGISLAAGLLFSLAPVREAWSRNFGTALKDGGRTSLGRSRLLVRRVLVVGEVAMATVLVVGAGLLTRSFLALERVDPGFDPQGVLSFELSLPRAQYVEAQKVGAFFDEVTAGIASLPGVQGVSTASGLPPVREVDANDTEFEGVPGPPEGPLHNVDYYQFVTAGYFETLRIPLMPGGRLFEAGDVNGEPVVVVNQRLAEVFWPGQNPIGRRLRPSYGAGTPWFRVVGVVGNVKQGGMKQPVGTELYFFTPQAYGFGFGVHDRFVVVRATGDPEALAGAVRAEVRRRDPALPVARLASLEEVIRSSTADSRFLSLLIGAFGALALVLAAIGTYGVLSFLVEERRQELGIRMALGATAESVLGRVLKQGLTLAGAGLAAGLLLALAGQRFLSAVLFGVEAGDPVTLVSVVGVLLVASTMACLVPARRAARVSPVETLKAE
ncbi:MAG TPA: ABC transporter permease [Thermoanaerobaculia bacterium]|nr:ABC transporter permease [Thermoanaerobaculia bacterium]